MNDRAVNPKSLCAGWLNRFVGGRTPSAICAGCGKPLAGTELLLLPHGEHAHANPDHACIIDYGRRWKGSAASALAQYGIRAPEGDDDHPGVIEAGAA